mgnify:CR=1 FL=1
MLAQALGACASSNDRSRAGTQRMLLSSAGVSLYKYNRFST